jgi:Tfp pilus assembly protein PilV
MRRREKRASNKAGFTVLEMALATVTLMVGIMSISAATLRMHQLSRQNREKSLAYNAVHGVAERVNSASAIAATEPTTWVETILAAYGPGGAAGDGFDVLGLTAEVGAERVGTIQIVIDETMTDEDLGIVMGMPRDLNGDGDALDVDVSADANMLPVIITARWRNKGVNAFIKHPLYIMGY